MENININLLRDHKFYLENFCKLKVKAGGLEPFILNKAQLDLFNTLNTNNRVIVLKARQLGFSTGVCGYFYVEAITNPGINVAIIAYNADLTAELLDKIKTFHRTTPAEIRPQISYNSKYEMSFPKLDSKILVLPSSENVGSGYTIHRCLLSELSKIDKAEEKMASLLPAIPPTGKLVIESSPKGQGNLFHRMWMSEGNYVKKRYGWWWGYNENEINQIRSDINNPSVFAQEYEMEFLASGRSVFSQDIIKEQRKNILNVGDKNDEHIVYKNTNDWVIYREPDSDGLYVCGADISEGVDGGDNSVGVIFNKKTGEEVAFYSGLISPDRFGDVLNVMGRKYNNALMVVESNNHGLTTITTLRQLMYPSLYFRPAKLETMGVTTTDRIGWRTTKVTRFLLIDEFDKATRDNCLIIHSKQTLDEMSVFIYDNNNNMVPSGSFHDDAIFGTAICFQGFKIMYSGKLDQLNYEDHMPKNFAY